jgi:hypothetical protein
MGHAYKKPDRHFTRVNLNTRDQTRLRLRVPVTVIESAQMPPRVGPAHGVDSDGADSDDADSQKRPSSSSSSVIIGPSILYKATVIINYSVASPRRH